MKRTYFWHDIELIVVGYRPFYTVHVKSLWDHSCQKPVKKGKRTIRLAKSEAIMELEKHGLTRVKELIWKAILG